MGSIIFRCAKIAVVQYVNKGGHRDTLTSAKFRANPQDASLTLKKNEACLADAVAQLLHAVTLSLNHADVVPLLRDGRLKATVRLRLRVCFY
jgi:hypothetical protein